MYDLNRELIPLADSTEVPVSVLDWNHTECCHFGNTIRWHKKAMLNKTYFYHAKFVINNIISVEENLNGWSTGRHIA